MMSCTCAKAGRTTASKRFKPRMRARVHPLLVLTRGSVCSAALRLSGLEAAAGCLWVPATTRLLPQAFCVCVRFCTTKQAAALAPRAVVLSAVDVPRKRRTWPAEIRRRHSTRMPRVQQYEGRAERARGALVHQLDNNGPCDTNRSVGQMIASIAPSSHCDPLCYSSAY